LISKYPLFQEWEAIEEAERAQVAQTHKRRTGPTTVFEPQYLPVQVHVAAPQHGRFTREVESDIVACNSINAIQELVKSSLVFELVRTNIDPTRTHFAGLMTYGPATKEEFSMKNIHKHTRGLFLDADAFKKWWLTVNASDRPEGSMVKIAVVLWDVDEAAAKRVALPHFWTEPGARILGNFLDGLECPIWDLDVEAGCRNYVKLQGELQQARAAAVDTTMGNWMAEKKALEEERDASKAMCDALANAINKAKLRDAVRLARQWIKSSATKEEGKGKGKAVDTDDEKGEVDEEDVRHDEDELMT
jgi:hypothetical protein